MAEIAPPPPQLEAITEPPSGTVRLSWKTWFQSVFQLLQALTLSGTTAQRPTTLLFVGRRYYDTTLGCEINLDSAGPPPVWHNGIGTTV